MNQADLTEYLNNTYSRQELAELLALAVDQGELPLVPDELPPPQPKLKRGRPTRDDQAQKLDALHRAIEQAYPAQTDVASLAQQAGMTRMFVARLRSDLSYLNRLSVEHGEYFAQLPLTFRGRLSPVWRAVLDLHFYKLMLDHPGKRLPLYRQHAWIWGIQLRPDPYHLSRRDSQERARVLAPTFKELRSTANWAEPQSPTNPMDEADWPCTEYCPVNQAWADPHILTVQWLRGVIGTLPWLPTDRIYVTATDATGALKQIIGLE